MVFLPKKSLEDQIASGGYKIAGGVTPWADKVRNHREALAQKGTKATENDKGGSMALAS